MSAGNLDLDLEAGAGWSLIVTYLQPTGTPFDWQGPWSAFDRYEPGDAVTFTDGNAYQATAVSTVGSPPTGAGWVMLVPVNVLHWSADLQIRDRVGGTVYLELTSGAGITVGATNGQFAIAATAEQTTALGVIAKGVYDLLVTPPTGQPERLLEGVAFVAPAVTG